MVAIQTGSVLETIVLKEGQLYLVADRAGDVKALNVEGHGLYYQDTRHLSLFELDLSGTRLILLSATGELNFMSNLQFANDTLVGGNGDVVAGPRTLSIRRNRFLQDGLHERLGIYNYNQHAVHLVVRLTFGSDFRDMFEVRGYVESVSHERGDLLPPTALENGLLLAFRALDGAERSTRVTFDPPPSRLEVVNERLRVLGPTEILPGISGRADPRLEPHVLPPAAAAVFELELPPMQFRSVTIHVAPNTAGHREPWRHGHSLDDAFAHIQASYAAWETACTRIETDHEVFDSLLRRARQDLRLLTDDVDGHLDRKSVV
jgi:glycogen debranching enzyme